MTTHDSSISAPAAVILAAGKGTRMKSDLPKVVHPVAGKPMVCWVVEACLAAGCERIVVVVGYQADRVKEALAEYDVEYVMQSEQLGTGHAVMMAEPLLKEETERDVFVLAGDGPLIRTQTLQALLQLHRDKQAVATLATSVVEDPTGYGRVIRDEAGGFDRIVEQKDASPEELTVCEINPSYYCFGCGELFNGLARVSNDNKQGEYYITDVPGILKAEGKTVCVVDAVPAEDVLSINTPEQLAEVDRILRGRLQAG